jgi:hypothetical protein
VEVGRFRFAIPEMKEEELAAFFGLELAMMVVDQCLTGPSQKE